MKKLTYALVIVGLLFAALPADFTTQRAAAVSLSWIERNGFNHTGGGEPWITGAGGPNSAVFASSVGTSANNRGADLWYCADDACSLVTTLGNDAAQGGEPVSVNYATGNTFAVCNKNGNGGGSTLQFHRSTNGGASWTTGTLVHTTSQTVEARGCGVASADGTNWVMLGVGTANTMLNVSRSSDGGASWSAYTQIDTSGEIQGVRAASKSATEFLAVYRAETNVVRTCKSTDAGANWSCMQFGTGIRWITAYYSTVINAYYGAYVTTTNAVNYWTSSDGNLFETTGVPALAGTTVHTADAAVHSDGRVRLIASTELSNSNFDYNITQSDDGGFSWTDWGNVFTLNTGSSRMFPRAALAFGDSVSFTGLVYRVAYGATTHQVTRVFQAGFAIAPAAAPTNTAPLDNIVSMDVDFTGSGMLIKNGTGSPRYVTALNPYSLGVLGVLDTQCNIAGGITATSTVLAYTTCKLVEGNPSANVDHIRLRSLNLTDPSNQWPYCGNSNVCPIDISVETDGTCASVGGSSNVWTDQNNLIQIEEMSLIPLTYEYRVNTAVLADPRACPMAYHIGAGTIVGVLEFTGSDVCDGRKEERAVFGAGGATQICAWVNGGRQYLGAVGTSATTKLYEYVPARSSTNNYLEGTLGSPISYTSLATAEGLDCAIDKLIIARDGTANNIRLLNITTGAVQWQTNATATTRGVALSGNGEWAFYYDAGTIHAAYASNGTRVGAFSLPSGSFREMRVDWGANNLWVATSEHVAHYEVTETISVIPLTCSAVSCLVPDAVPTGTAAPGISPTFGGPAGNTDNPLGQTVNYFNEKWGFDGSWLFGLAITSLVVVGFARVSGSPLVTAIGAFLGVGVSVALGVFPFWLLLVIVFLIIAVAGHRLFGGKGEGSE